MAFTYGGDPANSTLETVRFICGDTISKDPLLNDAEIDFIISREGNVDLAAANACERIAAKEARKITRSNLGLSKSLTEKMNHFLELADKLRESVNNGALEVFAGGLTRSGKETLASDDDAIQPDRALGMDDRPGANRTNDPRRDRFF